MRTSNSLPATFQYDGSFASPAAQGAASALSVFLSVQSLLAHASAALLPFDCITSVQPPPSGPPISHHAL